MLAPSPIVASPAYVRCGTLAPSPIVGVLGLDEAADLALGAEPGAGAQVGERADGGAGADHGERRPAVRIDLGAVADLDVGEGGVGADDGVARRCVVAPSSWVPGQDDRCRGRCVTSASIHVVAGSMMVTPSRMQPLEGAAVELRAEPRRAGPGR